MLEIFESLICDGVLLVLEKTTNQNQLEEHLEDPIIDEMIDKTITLLENRSQ